MTSCSRLGGGAIAPDVPGGLYLAHGSGLAAHVVVVLPVLVLAEGAAVARHVAPRARLTRPTTTVPACLQQENSNQLQCDLIKLHNYK